MECNIINISTHALTEGDNIIRKYIDVSGISTHALTEGDRFPVSCTPSRRIFQLTPSRRATDNERRRRRYHYFNSRPHGGRRNESLVSELVCISTHALTEGDRISFDGAILFETFQLTPSRRATRTPELQKQSCRTFQLTPSRRATEATIL